MTINNIISTMKQLLTIILLTISECLYAEDRKSCNGYH